MTPTSPHIVEQASELLDGNLGPEARRAADAHLATCAPCRALLAELDATRLALRRLPPPEVPPAMREALLARFDALTAGAPAQAAAERGREGRLRRRALLGVVAVVGVLAAAARHPSYGAAELVVSAGLLAAALALAATAGRSGARHAVLGVVAAALAALSAGRGGPLEPAEGALCVASELGGAGLVALLAWSAARRGTRAQALRALAGGAMAGALAADAALQVTCGVHLALAHLAAFHVAGVAAVAVLATRLARAAARPAAAA
jgi:hypothetical protein